MRIGLLLLIAGLAPASGQAPQQESPSGVIRITVNLVQVDAVVTDSKGRQVTNLKPSDFEILEDGRPQPITNFSYVFTASPGGEAKPALAAPTVTPAVPPALLRPQDVRRTIALVVDDLGLSFESTVYVRRALKEFVDNAAGRGEKGPAVRRFQPGDRISYGFEVYNAEFDPATNQAQLEGLIRIFYDQRKVAAFQPEVLSSKARRDRKIPSIAGGLQLSCSMEPGAYVLEATIADKLAKGKNRVASQWTDFEIAQAPPNCGNGEPPQH
jgi:hypothetical protein